MQRPPDPQPANDQATPTPEHREDTGDEPEPATGSGPADSLDDYQPL